MPIKSSGTLCRKMKQNTKFCLNSFNSVFLNIFDLKLLFCLKFQQDHYFVKHTLGERL